VSPHPFEVHAKWIWNFSTCPQQTIWLVSYKFVALLRTSSM